MNPIANLKHFAHPPKNGASTKPMSRPAGMPPRVPMAPKMPPTNVSAAPPSPPSLSSLLGIGGPAPVRPPSGPLPPNGNKTIRRAPRGRKPAMKGRMPGMGGY